MNVRCPPSTRTATPHPHIYSSDFDLSGHPPDRKDIPLPEVVVAVIQECPTEGVHARPLVTFVLWDVNTIRHTRECADGASNILPLGRPVGWPAFDERRP